MANKKYMALTSEEIITIYYPLMEVCEGLRETKENIFTMILNKSPKKSTRSLA